ncbi:MAG: hypothetical protein TECD_00488 [Hyphomicrobiaceae bacterium hypho_1]
MQDIVRSVAKVKTWIRLLSQLTDEELAMYGMIAKDQHNVEFEHLGAQILVGLFAFLFLAVGMYEMFQNGITGLAALYALIAVIPSFWLLKKFRTRRFWNKHCSAVAQEQIRRTTIADGKTD